LHIVCFTQNIKKIGFLYSSEPLIFILGYGLNFKKDDQYDILQRFGEHFCKNLFPCSNAEKFLPQ
jgi:hypothetical protein